MTSLCSWIWRTVTLLVWLVWANGTLYPQTSNLLYRCRVATNWRLLNNGSTSFHLRSWKTFCTFNTLCNMPGIQSSMTRGDFLPRYLDCHVLTLKGQMASLLLFSSPSLTLSIHHSFRFPLSIHFHIYTFPPLAFLESC